MVRRGRHDELADEALSPGREKYSGAKIDSRRAPFTEGMSRSFSVFARSQQLRRAFALTAVVLATGGLVLYKAPDSMALNSPSITRPLVADGKNATAFQGPGVHGTVSLSHSKVLSGTTSTVYAEIRVQADQGDAVKVRAPISLAVVLDTSGSMSGDKIRDAKSSILRLLSDMRDDDEIAMIHYASTSEVIQPLARVGNVRSSLIERVSQLQASGGTNIPDGLRAGARALDEAGRGRVRRVILVSDGLDSTRNEAEDLARTSFGRGITVSSLGIGNDFDEAYMGAVAQDGHGNFAFVKEGSSIASFLKRELEESATTTIENARVHLDIPSHMRFVSATGADALVNGDSVDLRLGAMFAGDEQRVVVELASDGNDASLSANASWSKAGTNDTLTAKIPTLSLVSTNDQSDVEKGRDGNVFASAVSVTASKRQLEANAAYARGDVATATSLAQQNMAALQTAAVAAPMAAPTLNAQMGAYAGQKDGFASTPPSSPKAKAMAKSGAAKDVENLRRATSF